MNGDVDRNFRTVRRFESLTELSDPLRTGRPKPKKTQEANIRRAL